MRAHDIYGSPIPVAPSKAVVRGMIARKQYRVMWEEEQERKRRAEEERKRKEEEERLRKEEEERKRKKEEERKRKAAK